VPIILPPPPPSLLILLYIDGAAAFWANLNFAESAFGHFQENFFWFWSQFEENQIFVVSR